MPKLKSRTTYRFNCFTEWFYRFKFSFSSCDLYICKGKSYFCNDPGPNYVKFMLISTSRKVGVQVLNTTLLSVTLKRWVGQQAGSFLCAVSKSSPKLDRCSICVWFPICVHNLKKKFNTTIVLYKQEQLQCQYLWRRQ